MATKKGVTNVRTKRKTTKASKPKFIKAVLPKAATQPKFIKAVLSKAATQPIDGDGFARGCRDPDSVKIGIPGLSKGVGGVAPAWVQATPSPKVHDRRRHVVKTVEGVLLESKITSTDFPLKPWHTYYDWNFFVRPDPHYRHLLGQANMKSKAHPGQLECEWDTAFLPSWAWPQKGGRIWLVGRWIYDCGHPGKHGHKTEIHPPKAVASFRSEAVRLPGNAGPTRAKSAVLYIGRKGGYWTSLINNQNYEFSIPLPPKPFAGAMPRFKVKSMTGRLPVRPRITPSPANNPRELKVLIPLKGVKPHPLEYGAIISGGWGDPRGTEAKKVLPVQVNVEKIFMDANLDPIGKDEWYVYVGVNGRWRVFKSLNGSSKSLNFRVNLDLAPTDKIHVTVCGFEADTVHDLMGISTGVKSKLVTERTTAKEAIAVAKVIRTKFSRLKVNENDRISLLSKKHNASTQRTFTSKAPDKDYRLRYTIARR